MRRTATVLILLVAALGAALAQQPSIRTNSVVNAASYIQPGLPNYGIAQGGMFILKGQGLGTRGSIVANAFPLQTTMGGTSMRITVGGTAVNVLMIYVVAGLNSDQFGPFDQLAGIVPSTTPTGSGTITVTYNGQTSAPASITIVPNEFGIFTINQGGTGPGVFTDPNFKVNTLVAAAHTGDQLFIWGTGLGAITASDAGAPPVGNLNVPVEVYVGNVKANISYQGRSGCCAGIDQILFTVPPGVQGCYVSVVVRIGNVVSNFVTMSIASSGNVCSDATGFATAELQKAQNGAATTIADIDVARVNVKLAISGLGMVQGNVDTAEGHIRRYQPAQLLGSPRGGVAALTGFPSAGCVVFPGRATGRFFDDIFFPAIDDPSQGLDAGPALNLRGPGGTLQIRRRGSAQEGFEYRPDGGILGGGLPPLVPGPPEVLAPGSYTVDDGSGGSDAGPFSTTLTIPPSSVIWTNQDAIGDVPRNQDLTLTAGGGGGGGGGAGAGAVGLVYGSSANTAAGAGAQFLCAVPSGTRSYSVPSWVLSALPASGTAADIPAPEGFLAVGVVLPGPARFQAPGVDAGYFNWGRVEAKNVNYR